MSYLQDKKNKQGRYIFILGIVVVLGVLFFTAPSLGGPLGKVGTVIAYPFWKIGNATTSFIASQNYRITTKKTLQAENERLTQVIAEKELQSIEYTALKDENQDLKRILGRNKDATVTIASILSRPNKTLYDTLIIDIGGENASVGDMVFAHGTIPIGTISEVLPKTAKVTLYSTQGVETQGIVSGTNTEVTLYGKGNNTFYVRVPREVQITDGTLITLPTMELYVIAKAREIVSDPRDAEKIILLEGLVNTKEIKFVTVYKQ